MNSKVINEKNLFYNVDFLRQKSCCKKFCAVIKANAYGHGACDIAKLLSGKVDYFAVANLAEAKEILNLNQEEKILILSPCSTPESLKNVEWTVSSKQDLEPLIALNEKVYIHLKINTGMNRYGMDENEAKEIIGKAKANKNIIIKGIYSHFYQAESAKQRNAQLSLFNRICNNLSLKKGVIKHICNTQGALAGAGGDMCRCGLGIYGYGKENLMPVLKIVSKISQIRVLEVDDKLGYNAGYIARKKTKIATIPIGYADGFERAYSSCYVYVNNKKCKVVGNVCMDCFFCDVSDVKDVNCGDEVCILGQNKQAEKFAKKSKKIVYEVLCGFNKMR